MNRTITPESMDFRRKATLRTPGVFCKPPRLGRRPTLWAVWAALAVAGCTWGPADRVVTLATLERAPHVVLSDPHRAVVADSAALREICMPLGSRLGFVELHSPAEWERLAALVPELRKQAGFGEGTLLGLVCWAGTPMADVWPAKIRAIRSHDGAALVQVSFRSGNFLPDGTAWIETVHVSQVSTVLAISVNGTMYYPEQLAGAKGGTTASQPFAP
ncbi:MAG: hypothetical protein AB1716_17170 [Planctomycetota bacterium]